jgi:hypothetical protein
MQLSTIGTQVAMTSLELVQFINNQRDVGAPELAHSDFLKKVNTVLGKDAGNFSSIYFDSMNREKPCYKFPKREACLMAMSYSYDLQAKVFDRMTALEQQQAPALPTTYIQALERLIETEKQKEAALLALDVAVATKAEIGSRREATSMATASVAVRERNKALEQLGAAKSMATIRAVNKATGEHFQFKPLKDYCKAHELELGYATDPLYGEVRTYPAQAWIDVYGVSLEKLFG